jgi:hypothetical protein
MRRLEPKKNPSAGPSIRRHREKLGEHLRASTAKQAGNLIRSQVHCREQPGNKLAQITAMPAVPKSSPDRRSANWRSGRRASDPTTRGSCPGRIMPGAGAGIYLSEAPYKEPDPESAKGHEDQFARRRLTDRTVAGKPQDSHSYNPYVAAAVLARLGRGAHLILQRSAQVDHRRQAPGRSGAADLGRAARNLGRNRSDAGQRAGRQGRYLCRGTAPHHGA